MPKCVAVSSARSSVWLAVCGNRLAGCARTSTGVSTNMTVTSPAAILANAKPKATRANVVISLSTTIPRPRHQIRA